MELFSDRTLDELRAAEDNLQDTLEKLTQKLDACKRQHAALSELLSGSSASVAGMNGSFIRSETLNDAIVIVLKEMGPIKSSEVAQELINQGYLDDKKTPLSTRVSTQMWRMNAKGMIRKGDSGDYSLVGT